MRAHPVPEPIPELSAAASPAAASPASPAAPAPPEADLAGRLAREVAARRAAEEAVRASEQRLAHVLAATEAAVWEIDLGTGGLRFDGGCERMLGWDPADIRDRAALAALVHPDDLEGARAGLTAHLEGRTALYASEHRMRARTGGWRWIQCRGKVVEWAADGRPLRFLGVSVNVTDRRELSARLLLADRMASVGTLAAGVAHEVNNPLAYVVSNVAWAKDAAARAGRCGSPCVPFGEVQEALVDAHEGALRVRDIVRGLRSLSRAADDEAPVAVEVARVVEATLHVARGETKHRARVRVGVEPVPPVLASESKLGQVLLNLVVNAAQAIAPGRPDENEIRVSVRREGARVALSVSDTGGGIPAEVLPRIFDPFFTTKGVGEGTGLGLAIAHGIVTGLGGELRVESAPGAGATFTVLLKVAPDGAARASEPPRAPAARRARVLVVDDEPNVAAALERTLSVHHDVVTARSGAEALRHVAEVGCDVVVSDVLMPEMTGLELRRQLSAIAPALAARMVFITGGATAHGVAEALARVPNRRLEKPFRPEELLAAIAEALS